MKRLSLLAVVIAVFVLAATAGILRVDTFWYSSPLYHRASDYVANIAAIWCPDSESDLRGFVGPNRQPNGFVVEWHLFGETQAVILESITGSITSPDGSIHPLSARFSKSHGERRAYPDRYYAYLSRGDYNDKISPGTYHVSVSYKINERSESFSGNVIVKFKRKAGFHLPFYSHYF